MDNNMQILVVDDDLRMRELIRDTLAEMELRPQLCGDSREALRRLESDSFDLVITDLKMPHIDGIGVLERAKLLNPEILVILVTGYGTIESAIEAIQKDAYDYIQKPFEPDDFLLVVRRAIGHIRLLRENQRLREEVAGLGFGELVGDSRSMKELQAMIARIAPLDTTVLLQGETGTGKELVARLLHRGSQRRQGTFLPVNCGAIAETLLESELFGHEAGAFTGADRRKQGLFEAVAGGTLFLDEINATSLQFQVKLLRVLQEGEIMRVGATTPVRVDVRIIAAANANLEREVEQGRFRRDLLYRLNVITVDIPPLRKRQTDIPLLAHHFCNKFSQRYQKPIRSIAGEVLERLLQYTWPGNVRELENVMERAVIMADSDRIRSVHLPNRSVPASLPDDFGNRLVSLADMEKMLIERTLQGLNGHKGRTAEILGISPTSLWRKMNRYHLR
ncbi:MAG TPA: sigma-54-dependent Fis family transcriptional regulator [Desulfobulbaceae bacterium]|nr:sigma-54-dependent Fis family transcriptional regulator [Desulfobulbaceae bacterium]